MESATPTRTPSAKTPRKAAVKSTTGIRRFSENFDPNLPAPTPTKKPISSPAAAKSVKRPPPRAPPQPPTAAAPVAAVGRKFIIAKKKTGVKQGGGDFRDVGSRRQAAYEALRASHEDFFKTKDMGCSGSSSVIGPKKGTGFTAAGEEEEEEEGKEHSRNSCGGGDGKENGFPPKEEEEEGMVELQRLEGSSKVRKMRSIMLEEARRSIPEAGRVMHLVKAFESILSISKLEGSGTTVDESKRKVVMNWPLPGIQPPPPPEAVLSSSSVCSSAEFFFPSKDFQLDSRLYSSTDSSNWRLSCGSTSSSGTSRRNSSDSSIRNWSKKLKVTSQHPFKLRTEQRGRLKEEHFLRKVKEMIMEDEKLRIPVAQGLPWTTDEPECLMKPSVKEATQPVDLILHSDVRAMERAEFDQYMALRVTLADQRKLEIERQQRLEEEERIKQLRKELVPRAQPMPYFDRPFVPKKSTRPRTVPKEPRFLAHKNCVLGDIREILKNK